MYDIIIIEYGNDIGIRYTIVDKEKTGKEFIIKEFKEHKQALDYLSDINSNKKMESVKNGFRYVYV